MSEILRRHAFSITFLAILFGFVFFWSDGDGQIQRLSGFTMGTSYELQLVDLPVGLALDQLSREVAALLAELDRGIFSTYAPDSELSRFNAHRVGVPFIASQELLEVLTMAQQLARDTDGAFDVTVGPLVNLWGFGPNAPLPPESVPDDEAIALAMQRVGAAKLVIDAEASQISKREDIYVDLSAIAKGFAVDRLAELFDDFGIDSYFLEVGGELKMKGFKPGGESWVPAIEAPVETRAQVYEIFFSRGETLAVAGSGDYRNYFEQDGIRYSHEIDPRTGRPISHRLAAAYVIDPLAARADALATAFMIMGLEPAMDHAHATGQAAYFIYKQPDGEFADAMTDAFRRYLDE